MQRPACRVGDTEIVRELLTARDDAEIVHPFLEYALEVRAKE